MAMEMVTVDEKSFVLTSLIRIVFFLLFLNYFIISKDFFSPFCYIIKLFAKLSSAFTGILRNVHRDAEDNKEEKGLSIQEVKKMMEILQNVCNGDEDEGEGMERQMEELFELEPSIEEVKEAFDVFDENEDGFIDSKELQRVLSVMEFSQISEAECERMIRAFDRNSDGRIDFQEFLQLTEQSFE